MRAKKIYLNNAGTSFPKPDAVLCASSEALEAGPSKAQATFDEGALVVANALGAAPERVLFTTSCTQALDVALLSLPWEEGDEILTSHLEHSAAIRPIETLWRLSKVKHLRAPYSKGEPFDLDFLERSLLRGHLRVVVLSHASNVTGEVLPVRRAADLAHKHGALLFLDAAQTFGLLDFDVEELGADLLTFAGHKGPLGPQGIGGLWAKESVRFDCNSAVCDVGGGAGQAKEMPGYCDVGGLNVAGLAALAAGLQAWGPEERMQRMQLACRLAATFAAGAREVAGVTVFGHHGGPQTATVSFVHEKLPLASAEAYFRKLGITLRVGTHCAPDALSAIRAESGTIRLSFGPQNTEDDLEFALSALLVC